MAGVPPFDVPSFNFYVESIKILPKNFVHRTYNIQTEAEESTRSSQLYEAEYPMGMYNPKQPFEVERFEIRDGAGEDVEELAAVQQHEEDFGDRSPAEEYTSSVASYSNASFNDDDDEDEDDASSIEADYYFE
ncbi:hypothetical protein T4B_1063 [Trichinella pseudospiralis]|uniref:Uncharacterized protein n=2 Tax=Trichinella pseudospiralis TaxID=6337 RepID=A0A0V1K5W0_TRIPS|nr:hypothetical protein T4E_342 [Trichinella pseudospiralis]KRY79658.1 hypothetical protein T4A_7567 [Trichinella pseudospiralis]KRY92809.1 hypothetical protein T4D_5996 [Trichinella pseudospiralis]KRZ33973.1 hypothetical protein T4B_1063 [Trichinella pseudospiralis]KRZ42595.1 hypothetical protein T4C_740 [Trichinella pseudospiralis]